MSRARILADLGGVTSTAAELNALDGITSDVTDLNYAKTLYDTGVTAAEFDFLDTTSGTPGSGTFLRGDKTWVAAGSTSASDLDSGTLATDRMADGTLVNTKWWKTTDGNWSTTSATEKAVTAFNAITVTSGNTIVIGCSAYMDFHRTGGSALIPRFAYIKLRYHTSSVAEDTDVSSIGTKVWAVADGRDLGDPYDVPAATYSAINGQGAWVASGTSFYIGVSMFSPHTSIDCSIKMTANDPFYIYNQEFKGDIMP